MGFFKKSGTGGSARPSEVGLFGNKSYLDVRELKEKAKSSSEEIRGVHYSKQKEAKAGLMEKMFSKEKFGSYVSKDEFEKRLKAFEKELPKISSYQQKERAKKELEFLKKMSESGQGGIQSRTRQKTKIPFEGWFRRAA